MMQFTYYSYLNLIKILKNHGYSLLRFCDTNADNTNSNELKAIIRHDVDLNLAKAEEMSQIEYNNGIKATYFIMVSSDYYNILYKKNLNSLNNIVKMGHEIGLHFDISNYNHLTLSDMGGGAEKRDICIRECVWKRNS